jgi:hypothetical protein
MNKPAPQIECDGTELYVTLDGIRIARRGRLGTVHALKWVSIVAGYRVRDVGADGIEVEIEIDAAEH